MSRLIEIKINPIAPVIEPITVSEAKQYCRVDFDDDDTLFMQLITTSRQRLEQYLCRVFLRSDCKAVYTQEGCGDKVLLSYSDEIDLTGSDYLDKLVGESYIDTCDKVVLLEYKAGYTVIPEWIKQAILIDVAWRYDNRGDVAATVINEELKEFLIPYVNWSFL